ncbi:MAG TPA: hypothetical protein VFA54_14325 [Bryobacterales bacterium]|nr:hypothetical protein [Bryobacterales bacterium]
MRNLFKIFCCAGLVAGVASAAQVQGVLMDKMCSMKAAKEGQSAAMGHELKCALMPPCQKSGYGVFTADNKFLAFDDAGNAQALKALQGSKKKDDLKVTVNGNVQGEMIKVTSLQLQ